MSLISLDSLIPFLLLSINITIRIWYICSLENLRSCSLFYRGTHLFYRSQQFGRSFLLYMCFSVPLLSGLESGGLSQYGRPSELRSCKQRMLVEGSRRMRRAGGMSRPGVQVWTGRRNHAKFSCIAVIHLLIHSLTLIKQKFDVYFKPSNVLSTRDNDEQANMVPALWVYGLHGGHQRDSVSTTGNVH